MAFSALHDVLLVLRGLADHLRREEPLWGGGKECSRSFTVSAMENSRVAALASSCGAGEASERPAGSGNCGAENCSRVLIAATQTFILFLNLLVCMSHFKLVMMGEARLLEPRLTDWAVPPWLIEYITWMKIRGCVSKCKINLSRYKLIFLLRSTMLWL